MFKQKFTAIGRLAADPEVRFTPSGQQVTNARVAIEDGYWSTDDNKWVSRTIWANLTLWGNTAEAFAEKAKKGDQVLFTASLVYDEKSGGPRTYPKDGETRAKFEFRVNEYQVFPKGGNAPAEPKDEDVPMGNDDDQIPF